MFVCPRCGAGLVVTDSGRNAVCSSCGHDAGLDSGVVDFVRAAEREEEQQHYDHVYVAASSTRSDPRAGWASLYYPMNERVRARVGNVTSRTVVLLGNGQSEKELSFLEDDPAMLVISDLSPAAVGMFRQTWMPRGRNNVVFAAIDALDLPFPDESIDLLYGYAFVHHLPDVDAFLAEAVRVLAPGGRCVFLDDAYAPLWQAAKRSVLRPLMRYYHRLEPPSPEDLRFTLGGGFREEQLAQTIRRLGCEPWFERGGLLHYLVTRASERLPPQRLWRALVSRREFLQGLIMLDSRLSRFAIARRNLIRLVWGLDKPPANI